LPNVACIILYQSCSGWFRNKDGVISISELDDYASANVDKYFWVLLIISFLGVIINILPPIRSFVDSIEEKATEIIKTPVMTKPTPKHRRVLSTDSETDEEASPMLRVKRHQAYLKYGSGPVLYKQGSMRAGPSVGKAKPKKNIKKSQVGKLYRTSTSRPKGPKVIMGADGAPMKAGNMYKRQDSL
jgi:proton-dependent oligopeptide transporter, POT family